MMKSRGRGKVELRQLLNEMNGILTARYVLNCSQVQKGHFDYIIKNNERSPIKTWLCFHFFIV